MSNNTNLVGWNCPNAYNDIKNLPCIGTGGASTGGVSKTINWWVKQELALAAMSDNRDVGAIRHWRDAVDWWQIAIDTSAGNDEADVYEEIVIKAFDVLIAEIKSEGVQPAIITSEGDEVGVLFADWSDSDSPVWYLDRSGKMKPTGETVGWDVLAWAEKAKGYYAIYTVIPGLPATDDGMELEITCDVDFELRFSLSVDDLVIICGRPADDDDKIIVYHDRVYREINGNQTCTWRAKSDLK